MRTPAHLFEAYDWRFLAEAAGRNVMDGVLEEVSFLGAVVRSRVRFGTHAISLDSFNQPGIKPPDKGAPVRVSFAREDLLVLEDNGKA